MRVTQNSTVHLATSVPSSPIGDGTRPSDKVGPPSSNRREDSFQPYPPTKTVGVVDPYHGTPVSDPYRWLEEAGAPDTVAWVKAEDSVTRSFLKRIPDQEAFRQRLTSLLDFERHGLPSHQGGKYFFHKNEGLQEQYVLWVARSLDDPAPQVLLDPNLLSADGTAAIGSCSVSDDGRHLAYAVSTAGSDWSEIRVRDVNTGKDLPDVLRWVKWSTPSWSKDGQGFYYSRFDEPKPGEELTQTQEGMKLCYHRLGTPQANDSVIYERKDHKDWMFDGGVTEDGRYLVVSVTRGGGKNQVFYKDLAQDAQVVELLTGFEHEYSFLGNTGATFYFKTNKDAPCGRIITVDLDRPSPTHWKEILPEREETLLGANLVGGVIVAQYLKDAHTHVRVHDLDGTHIRDVPLPGLGTAGGFGGKMRDTETFYAFTSFTNPGEIYRYDLKTGVSTLWQSAKVDFNPHDYSVDQVFYTSKDGTRVPMFLVHHKDVKLDGQNPTLLSGYGGFNVSMVPAFSTNLIAWLERGGVFAMPNLRGGGEYGEAWHQAGTRTQKQNVFDDFIAAAEWLISQGWTSPDKLAICGGSNGGLLVAACALQRPELFGAAVIAAGVLDMLRFHKFTIGRAWVDDYGSPDDPEQFEALHAYSPYHNVKEGVAYPATLITTADHDDRVVPAHSFKFAARLQAAQGGPAPILLRVEENAGHGAGTPLTKGVQNQADVYAFIAAALGVSS